MEEEVCRLVVVLDITYTAAKGGCIGNLANRMNNTLTNSPGK